MTRLLVGLSVQEDGEPDRRVTVLTGSGVGFRHQVKGDTIDSDALSDFLSDAQATLDDWSDRLEGGVEAYLQDRLKAPHAAQPGGPGLAGETLLLAENSDSAFIDALGVAVDLRMNDESLDVNALAVAVGLSRSTLYRRLRATQDMSPMDFIWKRRLQRAADLFAANDELVVEVSYACGFRSVAHFSRRFYAYAGCSPTAYMAARNAKDEFSRA